MQAAWIHESAFRQECVLGIVLLPVAFWIADTWVEVAVLMGVCFLVLIVELLNSAVEAAIDRVGDEHHELSGRAKDLGSAAVFVSLALTLLAWAAVAWKRFSG